MVEDADPRSAAIGRLKAKRGFTQHLVSYVAVNLLMIAIWLFSGGGYFWPIWIIAPWGFGLAMHAWSVYGQRGITEDDIEREMRRGGDMP